MRTWTLLGSHDPAYTVSPTWEIRSFEEESHPPSQTGDYLLLYKKVSILRYSLQSSTGDEFVQVRPHATPGSAKVVRVRNADDAREMKPDKESSQGLHLGGLGIFIRPRLRAMQDLMGGRR